MSIAGITSSFGHAMEQAKGLNVAFRKAHRSTEALSEVLHNIKLKEYEQQVAECIGKQANKSTSFGFGVIMFLEPGVLEHACAEQTKATIIADMALRARRLKRVD